MQIPAKSVFHKIQFCHDRSGNEWTEGKKTKRSRIDFDAAPSPFLVLSCETWPCIALCSYSKDTKTFEIAKTSIIPMRFEWLYKKAERSLLAGLSEIPGYGSASTHRSPL